MKLNKKYKERVKLFVDALESGEYKKAIGTLGRKVGKKQTYCAEGLLCEIYRQRTRKGSWVEEPNNYNRLSFCLSLRPTDISAPEEVTNYFFGDEETASSLDLIQKSDNKWSFARIAKFLRKELSLDE